jgi:hypothetical protein
VCGASKRCHPSNWGILFDFQSYYSPDVHESTKKEDVAFDIVGSLIKDNLYGNLTFDVETKPFDKADIIPSETSRNVTHCIQ